MQNKITKRTPLLNENGKLTNEIGYAYEMMYDYERSLISSSQLRVKEWDFYQFHNNEFVVQLTIGHSGYAGTCCCTMFEFATGNRWENVVPLILPMKKLNLPSRTDIPNTIKFENKNFKMFYEVTDTTRRLVAKGNNVDIDVTMQQPHRDGMVIVVPFDKSEQFYLNHKINCMPTNGKVRIKDKEVEFTNAMGLLDWGRGVWPYRQQWWWGNGGTTIDGVPFGFNVGWGFGNPVTTENMLFYDGKGSKLEGVKAEVDTTDYMKPWTFHSTDGRFEMVFTPTYDNYTNMNFIIAHNYCHQVWGKFNGKAILDDGKIIEVKDMLAFCEHSCNRW
ncbi:MAG: DUF2804 domain-containing protein [Clostridia bacterium]|nr:DUF2804 domain-containing protein [Clostridia bacterium]